MKKPGGKKVVILFEKVMCEYDSTSDARCGLSLLCFAIFLFLTRLLLVLILPLFQQFQCVSHLRPEQ